VNAASFRATDAQIGSPAQPGVVAPEAAPVGKQPKDPVWIDLTALNRAAFSVVQEQYGLPPEVMTYLWLRYQSTKLIHAGPALFLVTFLAVPSPRHVFTTRELKICVTPTLVVTLCGPSGRAQPDLARALPLPKLSGGKIGQLLCGLLEGVTGSYEAIVKTVTERRLDEVTSGDTHRWRRRIEKLVHFLRDEQILLGNIAREGSKLFTAEESRFLSRLGERVGVLARVTWDFTRQESSHVKQQ
jgi:Mg2+ and Co2+ transporter CorA